MPYTPQKKVIRSLEGEVTDIKVKRSKPKKKDYTMPIVDAYIRDRDRDDYRVAILKGDIDTMNFIAKRHGFEVREKDKKNVKI